MVNRDRQKRCPLYACKASWVPHFSRATFFNGHYSVIQKEKFQSSLNNRDIFYLTMSAKIQWRTIRASCTGVVLIAGRTIFKEPSDAHQKISIFSAAEHPSLEATASNSQQLISSLLSTSSSIFMCFGTVGLFRSDMLSFFSMVLSMRSNVQMVLSIYIFLCETST